MPVCGGVSWWRRGFAGALLCGVLLCTIVLRPARVRANDFEEFEAARSAYESQDYARAARLFEALGGGDTPSLSNRSLLLESKKYLGASYLFLNKLQRAEAEFERLLRLDPQYMLDPLGFPQEVQRLFARVQARLEGERNAAEEARRHEQQTQTEHTQAERQRWERMIKLAETEHLQEKRSRWVALMPFGIGQVQNGHGGLGAVLAVSEGSLLLISFVSWLVHENLRGQVPTSGQRDEFNVTERVSRYTNQISLGLFGALALTGIIDAQMRFEGDVTHTRKRELPDDLKEPPRFSLRTGPGSAGLDLQLRF